MFLFSDSSQNRTTTKALCLLSVCLCILNQPLCSSGPGLTDEGEEGEERKEREEKGKEHSNGEHQEDCSV